MKNSSKNNASTEASTTGVSINETATSNTTTQSMDATIKLIALTPDGGTDNVNAILFPREDAVIEQSPLSEEEKASLVHYEAIIKRGFKTYAEVGEALFQIQSRRLYRAGHATFEAYVIAVWGFKRAQAYRVINAYKALDSITDEDSKALSESQVRLLTALTPEQRNQALRLAKELAGDKKRTAVHIKTAADEILGRPAKGPKPANKPAKPSDDPLSDSGGGETARPSNPPAPDAGGGTTSPGGDVVTGTVFTAVKPLELIVENLRDSRKEILAKRDINAAIQLLFRLEADLQAHIAQVRFSSMTVVQGAVEHSRQLQAA